MKIIFEMILQNWSSWIIDNLRKLSTLFNRTKSHRLNNYEEQRIWNVEWNIELYHCSALAFTTVRLRSFYRWIKAIMDIWYIGYEEYIWWKCDGRVQYWVLLQFKKEISWRKREKRNGYEYWFLLLKSQWCFTDYVHDDRFYV